MKISFTKSSIAVAAVALTTVATPITPASATTPEPSTVGQDARVASGEPGWCLPRALCFEDYGNDWGRVWEWNLDWTDTKKVPSKSGRSWNDRADYFYNNDGARFAYIHEDVYRGGRDRIILSFRHVVWYDTVSGNSWYVRKKPAPR